MGETGSEGDRRGWDGGDRLGETGSEGDRKGGSCVHSVSWDSNRLALLLLDGVRLQEVERAGWLTGRLLVRTSALPR